MKTYKWFCITQVAQLNIHIFQGSVATDLLWGGRFYYSFLQFICECKSERIIKNDPHLPKL